MGRTTAMWVFVVTSACVLLGCEPADEPSLCVVSAETSKPPPQMDRCPPAERETEPVCPASIAAGNPYFVRHALPDGLASPGPLAVHIETPCAKIVPDASEEIEMTHVDGIVLFSRLAPKGAECLLTVTATIANSELRCSTNPVDPSACSSVETLCGVADSAE